MGRRKEKEATSPWQAAKTLQTSESSSTASATVELSKSRCSARASEASFILERGSCWGEESRPHLSDITGLEEELVEELEEELVG